MTNPRALVIDDHPANLRLVTYVLESRGIDVECAVDAESALAALDRGCPDVILMDVHLPGTDGLTLTRRLRAQPRFATVPIIAVTAYAMASDETAARESGCTAFVTKPINTRALAELVKSLLDASATG